MLDHEPWVPHLSAVPVRRGLVTNQVGTYYLAPNDVFGKMKTPHLCKRSLLRAFTILGLAPEVVERAGASSTLIKAVTFPPQLYVHLIDSHRLLYHHINRNLDLGLIRWMARFYTLRDIHILFLTFRLRKSMQVKTGNFIRKKSLRLETLSEQTQLHSPESAKLAVRTR